MRFARAQGMSYRLWLALHYLSTSHDLPIPAHVLKRLRARGVSLVERVENYLYLGPAQRMYKPLIFPALDYWRYLRADRPGRLIMRYPAYLKRRWQSRSKTQIARAAGGYVKRTLRTRRPHPPGSD